MDNKSVLRKAPSEVPPSPRTTSRIQKQAPNIALFGHFGMSNFGNECTLKAILYHLRQRLPYSDFRCICTGPSAAETTHNLATLPISRTIGRQWRSQNRAIRMLRSLLVGIPSELYRWFDAAKVLNSIDVLIIPGTGLLNDAYGLRGWGPYNTFKWSVIAKIRGCKLLFVSVGAGPLYRRSSRVFVKSALRLANWRSFRDRSSLQYLKKIGFEHATDREYPDLAFSLPPAMLSQNGNSKGSRRVVGLGLMEYAGRYSVANPTATTFRIYLENLGAFVEWLLRHDYNVRLLIGDLCDRAAVQEFQRLLKERLTAYNGDRIIAEPIESVEDLLWQLSHTDLVVATRFHNVLLALLSDKPAIAISFHHKCASLMSAMGLSEYCVDINDFTAEELIGKVRDLEKNAEQLKSAIREKAQQFREELDEQYEYVCREVCG